MCWTAGIDRGNVTVQGTAGIEWDWELTIIIQLVHSQYFKLKGNVTIVTLTIP